MASTQFRSEQYKNYEIREEDLDTGLEEGQINASSIPTDTTNFDNNLSSADIDVQKALDTLDDISSKYTDYPFTEFYIGSGKIYNALLFHAFLNSTNSSSVSTPIMKSNCKLLGIGYNSSNVIGSPVFRLRYHDSDTDLYSYTVLNQNDAGYIWDEDGLTNYLTISKKLRIYISGNNNNYITDPQIKLYFKYR